jgi:hypothetical protein
MNFHGTKLMILIVLSLLTFLFYAGSYPYFLCPAKPAKQQNITASEAVNNMEKQPLIFKYPFSARLIYRYSIVPANLLLLGYLVPFMFAFQWMKFFYAAILALALYLLNSYFFNLVRCVPYHIEVVNDTVVCKKFFLSSKTVQFTMKEITGIKGGVFDGGNAGIYRISIQGIKHEIIFFRMLKGNKVLQDALLRSIPRPLYHAIIERVQSGISQKL